MEMGLFLCPPPNGGGESPFCILLQWRHLIQLEVGCKYLFKFQFQLHCCSAAAYLSRISTNPNCQTFWIQPKVEILSLKRRSDLEFKFFTLSQLKYKYY